MEDKSIENALSALTGKFPLTERERIDTGVRQAARFWRKDDGSEEDFRNFCLANFVAGADLDALFERFEVKLEAMFGYFNALQIALRLETDEDRGDLLPVDTMFSALAPAAHLEEDLFKAKLAFCVLLNFPAPKLEECLALGVKWNRKQWALARLALQFVSRVTQEVNQIVAKAYSEAENYINTCNIYMDHVVDANGKPMFAQGLLLISHWGLRDEIKSLYADPSGLEKQKLIHDIMARIITQEIPRCVINSKDHLWNPVDNTVDGKPAEPEPDTRYEKLLAVFKAHRLEDKYYPDFPTLMDRRFKLRREILESDAQSMLESVLNAPVSSKIAELISKRLGRNLLPFDIWYDGFKSRGSIPKDELDKKTAAKYPSLDAFQKDIHGILSALGFSSETSSFLSEHIDVSPARGAGHAWPPMMHGEKAHLRARVPKGGMDYKGFNVAMHELGHCVEEVFSLYRMDHYLLRGVPNTAFTEGFAFVFQDRDLEILGIGGSNAGALDSFWSTREIAAVALVDMRVWKWLYKHPRATPAKLKEAVIAIARDVWNKYNAEVFGVKDSPILAVYSHMISGGLYLPDYPLGFIIACQIEEYFEGRSLAQEMERMCRIGGVTPAEWMRQAVSNNISAQPLIAAAEKALTAQ